MEKSKPRIIVSIKEPIYRNGNLSITADIFHDTKIFNQLWFEMPESQADLLGNVPDAFLIALLFHAMRYGSVLEINQPVSESIVRQLNEFQRAWSRWLPARYKKIEIIAPTIKDIPSRKNVKIIAFSGGLDSSFSAWGHKDTDEKVSAGLMVHGFDIPLSCPTEFESAFENSKIMLGSIGLEALWVKTNFRELNDKWHDAHGAAVISALHLFKGHFSGGMIGSSHTYDTLRVPWGSNPLTDPLLASKYFDLTHDGCAYYRYEKAGVVAQWPVAMQRLRVCWEGPFIDRNCGECLRCVGTAICFSLEKKGIPSSLGIFDLPKAINGLASQKVPAIANKRLRELYDRGLLLGYEKESWMQALNKQTSLLPWFVMVRKIKRIVPYLRKKFHKLGLLK